MFFLGGVSLQGPQFCPQFSPCPGIPTSSFAFSCSGMSKSHFISAVALLHEVALRRVGTLKSIAVLCAAKMQNKSTWADTEDWK